MADDAVVEPDEILPSAAVLPLSVKVMLADTDAVTVIWSAPDDTTEVAQSTWSTYGDPPWVFRVPVLSFPAGPTVDEAPAKLKQYHVLTVRSVAGNITETPLTDEAVFMPGHAVAAELSDGFTGKLVVVTVQLEAVDEIVQSTGKSMTTFVSVPTVSVSIQAVPEIAEPVASLSNLTKDSVTVAPAFLGIKNG